MGGKGWPAAQERVMGVVKPAAQVQLLYVGAIAQDRNGIRHSSILREFKC